MLRFDTGECSILFHQDSQQSRGNQVKKSKSCKYKIKFKIKEVKQIKMV